MVKSMYAGVAGLRTHQQKMDVIGNNIANVNTYGYKAGRATFKESIYQTIYGSSDGTNGVNNAGGVGGMNPSQIGYGSQLGSVDLMFSTGNYAPTDSQTDCMIDGGGFFLVGPKYAEVGSTTAADGAADGGRQIGDLLLTRLGNFTVDGDGYLVDGNQNVVYGYLGAAVSGDVEFAPDGDNLRPVRIPLADGTMNEVANDGERMNLKNLKIDSNGYLIGTDGGADGTGNVIVTFGQVAVANVPNPNGLEKNQGPYYNIVKNTGTVEAFPPGQGSTGTIMSNGLEMANVDLAREFSEMITTQRGFQANTKIITVTDEMLQDLVNLKR